MAFDAFMVIKVRGKETLPGESTDAAFAGACGILEFAFKSSDALSREVTDDAQPAGFGLLDDSSTDSSSVGSSSTHPAPVKDAKRLSVTLSKHLDSASPGLLRAYCTAADPKQGAEATAFDSVHLIFRKAGGSSPLVYLKLNLYKVDVTAYSLESGNGTAPPAENLTLSFESYKVEYTSQSAAGTSSAKSKTKIMGWDFEKNSAEVDAGLPAGFGLF
jgi:type VI secretion system secreted protein Hcp